MSEILIKDIEIPKKDDIVIMTLDSNGKVNVFGRRLLSLLSPHAEVHGLRIAETEAVALPEHGRLGDLDSIERKIQGKIDDVPKEKDGTRTVKQAFYANGLLRAKELVGHAPTVIEASN